MYPWNKSVKMKILYLKVGCLGFSGPLRQYFSLYRAISERGQKKKEKIDERTYVQISPIIIEISGTPRQWKFTYCTTRPTATPHASPATGFENLILLR